MASEVVGGRVGLTRLATTRTGAIALNATFTFDPQTNPAYRAFLGSGLDAVQIMSPIAAAGAADLEITVAGVPYVLAGGGNTITIPGPINSMRVKALNVAVGGSGSDDVLITPMSRLRTGAM